MCIVSMIHDHYNDRFAPWFEPNRLPWDPFPLPRPAVPVTPPPKPISDEIAEALRTLRQLIDEYREAIAKAKRLDELTGQPDCEDPKKASLEERVTDVERQLSSLLQRVRIADNVDKLIALAKGDAP